MPNKYTAKKFHSTLNFRMRQETVEMKNRHAHTNMYNWLESSEGITASDNMAQHFDQNKKSFVV